MYKTYICTPGNNAELFKFLYNKHAMRDEPNLINIKGFRIEVIEDAQDVTPKEISNADQPPRGTI